MPTVTFEVTSHEIKIARELVPAGVQPGHDRRPALAV